MANIPEKGGYPENKEEGWLILVNLLLYFLVCTAARGRRCDIIGGTVDFRRGVMI